MSNLKGGTKKDTKMRIRAFPVSIYGVCKTWEAGYKTRVTLPGWQIFMLAAAWELTSQTRKKTVSVK